VQLITDNSTTELLANLRHEFAIGPLREHPLFDGKARQYYCTRCDWTLLVSGTKVALLGENSRLLAGDAGMRLHLMPDISLCPVLEAIASEMFDAAGNTQPNESGTVPPEPREGASNNVRPGSHETGPLARLFGHLRRSVEGLVRHT
jgi:hypothetical protein